MNVSSATDVATPAAEMRHVYSRQQDDMGNDSLSRVFEETILQMLQERHNYRMERKWRDADSLHRKLVKMGVVIDDKSKTWALVAPLFAEPDPGPDGVACEFCGCRFRSRNLVFKHLRDPKQQCGQTVVDEGGISQPPSMAEKQRKIASQTRVGTQAAARHAPAEACLWFGDIPASWGIPSRLKQLLYKYTPRGVPQPWLKKVVRKNYKDQQTGRHLGYAIVCYRDGAEASSVMLAMDGLRVAADEVFAADQLRAGGSTADLAGGSFVLKVRAAEHGDSAPAKTLVPSQTAPGLDPPLEEQLRPLSIDELVRRVALLQAMQSPRPVGEGEVGTLSDDEQDGSLVVCAETPTHSEALAAATTAYTKLPRPVRLVQGRQVPERLTAGLLATLQSLRWPAKNQRPLLSSDRYLVLLSSSANGCYGTLRQMCSDLMEWADSNYYYSAIAVTKNFVSSPHIDELDRTYGYAVALGNYSGGELCVDSIDEDGIHRVTCVETRNRIARVDGRNVHWVRSFTGGDRYSLIFYDTSEQRPSLPGSPVVVYW